MHVSGVNPRPPTLLLCDGSDADDACDAVLRISLYHIPDSASLASSASFGSCVFRSTIIFVEISCILPASFDYNHDGDDDDDGVCGIWYRGVYQNIVITVSIVIEQASRFNLRLACFYF